MDFGQHLQPQRAALTRASATATATVPAAAAAVAAAAAATATATATIAPAPSLPTASQTVFPSKGHCRCESVTRPAG